MPLPIEPTRDPKAEAQELRDLRESFGLTQERMALRLDVTHGTYSRWESGRVLAPLMALELMRAWKREDDAGKKRRKK